MRKLNYLWVLWMLAGGIACEQEDPHLPSVEERTSMAIEELRDLLTEPANGWRIDYHPIPESGTYFMVLNFDGDGTVNIRSDVSANGGEFYDHTIPYRIDAALGIELIFETYGVFHYLFELQQASFGAEFEFIFKEEDGDNLVFESKSDLSDRTEVTFQPASTADLTAFSEDLAENLEAFAGQSPRLFGGVPPSQQLYFSGPDISVFWAIDLVTRTLNVHAGGQGSTLDEIITNASLTAADHFTGYVLQNGSLVLEEPYSQTIAGTNITISEVGFADFSMTGPSLCDSTMDVTPVYTGTVPGLGAVTVTKSLFNNSGSTFQPQTESFYAVNIPFIFDADFNSLVEEGSIADNLPNAVAFIMTYGFDNDSIPANSVGFLVELEDESTAFYLRSFEMTETKGNAIAISLLDDYYFEVPPNPGEQAGLEAITDEIFYGGTVYAYELPIQGLTAFQLYNPCNAYEFVLVQ